MKHISLLPTRGADGGQVTPQTTQSSTRPTPTQSGLPSCPGSGKRPSYAPERGSPATSLKAPNPSRQDMEAMPPKKVNKKRSSKVPASSQPERTLSEDRKHHDRCRKREQRAKETPEERESRLQSRRDYRARKVREASSEERIAQREDERRRKNEQRARIREAETSQERDARLQKRREYLAKFYGEPVAEKRKQRTADELREYERKQKRDQRARETPEERERRLQKMRDYSASRRANKTATISAKVKDATRQRVAALKASRTALDAPWDGKSHDPRKWKDYCKKDMEAKLASGLWKRNSDDTLVAQDPNLQWHCPAGANCKCHLPHNCPTCVRIIYGCRAQSCPRCNP